MSRIIEILHRNRDLTERDGSSIGGVTIAFTTDVAVLPSGNGLIVHVAIASCRDEDKFNREAGRLMAEQRLYEYLKNLTPARYTASVFAGLGYETGDNIEAAPHSIPFSYREGMPFILSSQWDTTEFACHVASGLLGNLHPELA